MIWVICMEDALEQVLAIPESQAIEEMWCRTAIASTPDTAAEQWAEEYEADCAEYDMLGGASEIVWVWEKGKSETRKKYSVTGETVPHYYAVEL